MTTTDDKLVQYLIEARAMEQALVRTLQAHIAMTPSGAYRSGLETHLRETRGHAERLGRRLADLGHGAGVAATAYDVGQRLVGQLLSVGKAPLDMLRGASPEEKLLKNAKDEAASEALEIATYDAIEQLARLAGDRLTARLAAEHRADEERMLATLREQIPVLTAAVVGAEVEGRPTYDPARTGIAQAADRNVRAARNDLADAVQDAARAVRGDSGGRRRAGGRSSAGARRAGAEAGAGRASGSRSGARGRRSGASGAAGGGRATAARRTAAAR